MDRAAVFVDAGYLFAAGSMLIANEKLPRGQLNLDFDSVLKLFRELTTELTGLPLLRIYWYDAATTGPTPQQLALAYRPNVKLRLGSMNQQGQQKGVDSLVVRDLVDLARNRAMADVLLLTGDEDIRSGVQEAQEFGIRVHLIGIAPARENQSGSLVQEADNLRELTLPEVQTFLTTAGAVVTPSCVSPAPIPSMTGPSSIEELAKQLAAELNAEEMEAVLRESLGGSIPAHIDRRLLTASTQLTGETLSPAEKRRARAAFLDACRDAATSGR